jgi:hypothetical protein
VAEGMTMRDAIAALFRSAPGEPRLGDEPPGVIADRVMEQVREHSSLPAVLGLAVEGAGQHMDTIEAWERALAELKQLRARARKVGANPKEHPAARDAAAYILGEAGRG